MLRNRYKRTFPFEKRKEEAKRILEKYPDRVPVICERVNKTVPDMDKRKFLPMKKENPSEAPGLFATALVLATCKKSSPMLCWENT